MEITVNFITAKEVSALTGISKSGAYRLIKQLNDELKGKGCITFKGRVNKAYFDERVFGKEVR